MSIKITNNELGREYIKQSRGMRKYHFRQKVRSFFKKLIFWLIIIIAFAGLVQYFRWAYPTEKIVIKEVAVERPIEYPVLKRIAKCESNDKHFGESGQVLMVGNTNKSVDVGRYQINTLWFKKANEMGLDLTDEKDNEAFAIYLYKTYGTEPWIHSKKCWNK
jgi:muramidase (phage lysozyme)